MPGAFGGISTQLSVFIVHSTKEQIAYSLGNKGTAIDFILQKPASFPQASFLVIPLSQAMEA
jgi:hypothetical protein